MFRIALVGMLAACAGPAGCCGGSAETSNYEQAYDQAISHELTSFSYKRPLADAWPEIMNTLGEYGYVLLDKSPVEGRTVYSSFKGASAGEYRILLHVTRVDASNWRLSVQKQYRSIEADGGETLTIESRKADPEIDKITWTIAQRVEPLRSIDLEKTAKDKGDRAAAVGRGCDRGCAACGSMIPAPK
jgi:hypothetical protein